MRLFGKLLDGHATHTYDAAAVHLNTDGAGEPGHARLRGLNLGGDPYNLTWVMPAEEAYDMYACACNGPLPDWVSGPLLC